MAQEIRRATNLIEIKGVVKEHKLGKGKTSKGDNYINGSLVVKAGEFTEITVKVFVTQYTKKGKVKQTYENLKDILDGKHKTMAEVQEEEAVKIEIWGNDEFSAQFKEDIYKSENSPNAITKTNIDLGYGNVKIDYDIKPEEYKATFDVELYISKVEEESNEEESTGRTMVQGWVPLFDGSVLPLEIVTGKVVDEYGEYNFGEEILNSVDEGVTMSFWGNINYKVVVEKTPTRNVLGRAKPDKKRYVHELVGTGAEFVEGANEYDIEDIQKAILERQNKIQEVENETDNKNSRGKLASSKSGNSNLDEEEPILLF